MSLKCSDVEERHVLVRQLQLELNSGEVAERVSNASLVSLWIISWLLIVVLLTELPDPLEVKQMSSIVHWNQVINRAESLHSCGSQTSS